MLDLAPVYICSICGEVTDVEAVEMIDCERDDVWIEMVDARGHEVSPKLVEGAQCYKKVIANSQ